MFKDHSLFLQKKMKFNLSDKCCSLMFHCAFSNSANRAYTKFIGNTFNIICLNCTYPSFPGFGDRKEKGKIEMPRDAGRIYKDNLGKEGIFSTRRDQKC